MRPILPLFTLLPLLIAGCGGSPVAVVSPGKVYAPKRGFDARDIEVLLREHNRVRADVGVGSLSWSKKLGNYAQAWADHLAATRCAMQHRPGKGEWQQHYGENLFMGTAGYYGPREAVVAWESEKADYRYGTFTGAGGKPVIGHYTQVIWKNSTRVGCGQALCQGNVIIACNYDPPGNFIGQKPY